MNAVQPIRGQESWYKLYKKNVKVEIMNAVQPIRGQESLYKLHKKCLS